MKAAQFQPVKRFLMRWLPLITAMMLLGCAQSAFSQWVSPSPNPDNNIYYNAGKVGIGTISPGNSLHVSSPYPNTAAIRLDNSSASSGRVYDFNPFRSGVSNSGFELFDRTAEVSRIAIDAGGNVGIGTASPAAKLDVAGTAQAQTLGVNSGNYSGSLYWGNSSFAVWYMTGSDYSSSVRFKTWDGSAGYSDKVTFQNDGKVGIGTTSPTNKFTVRGSGAGYNDTILRIERNYDGLVGLGAVFGLDSANTMAFGTVTNHPFLLTTNNTERMRIDISGNVGIGKPNPTEALDVVGNISLTGTINAKYQDVAEWVPSSEQFSAGTVVVLDSTKSNQVISSSVSYDTRVAGVISAQPGIALGEKSDSTVLVATTGRVKVKVDASKGPIHIGDLLVTSDVPGVAMKSEAVNLGGVRFHRPGTLIGKALESLEKGSGTILVLLSLQ